MSHFLRITNLSSSEKRSLKALSADNFISRLRGYLQNNSSGEYDGIFFVYPIIGRISAAIHTSFLNVQLLALWVDQNNIVVDKLMAKPWQVYIPKKPSKYLLETSPNEYNFWNIGDKIEVYEI